MLVVVLLLVLGTTRVAGAARSLGQPALVLGSEVQELQAEPRWAVASGTVKRENASSSTEVDGSAVHQDGPSAATSP